MSSSFNIVAIDGRSSNWEVLHFQCYRQSTGLPPHRYRCPLPNSDICPAEVWHQSTGPRRGKNALETIGLGTSITAQQAFLTINGCRPKDTEIRSPEVNAVVAHFAAIASIRKFLFDYQRSQEKVAKDNGFPGLVMEGRDIGSVIFPEAQHRFYLHADAQTRALRRKKQGQTDAIQQRDAIDASRKEAPLKVPRRRQSLILQQYSLEVITIIIDNIQSA